MISRLAHRSGRYTAETEEERRAVASRSSTVSNNASRRRRKGNRHKTRVCVRSSAAPPNAESLPPAVASVTPDELEIAADGAAQNEEEKT